MNELDEHMGNVYQKTNTELINILKEQQTEMKMSSRRSCIALIIVCVLLCVSVMFISCIGYLNNRHWLEVFNSYEYSEVEYSQNGNGFNNINTGTMEGGIDGAEISN